MSPYGPIIFRPINFHGIAFLDRLFPGAIAVRELAPAVSPDASSFGQTREVLLQRMVTTVQEMFPSMPTEVIFSDLQRTNSVELTTDRILSGTIAVSSPLRRPSSAMSSGIPTPSMDPVEQASSPVMARRTSLPGPVASEHRTAPEEYRAYIWSSLWRQLRHDSA